MSDLLTKYKTIAFIDSNIILEGKPFESLPWSELDAEGPILVMLLPQVLREIDAKKRDGRLQTHARAFNRLIAPAAVSGSPLEVLTQLPAVDICIARCAPIPWTSYDDLDPGEGDCKVVAELLNVLGVPADGSIFVSNDINPIGMVSRHKRRTFHVSDNWQRQPEPSPADKEIQRLKGRVIELEAKEPKIEIECALSGLEGAPFKIYRVAPLTAAEQERLVARVLEKNRRPAQPALYLQPFRDYSFESRYETYETKTVPAYAAKLSASLELLFGQVPFSLAIRNVGKIQAEGLVVEVGTSSGWINDKFVFTRIDGPAAPTPRDSFFQHIAVPDFSPAAALAARHEVVFDPEPDRSPSFAAMCRDFRHGREWRFEGVLWLDPRAQSDVVTVSVRVTAANKRGEIVETFRVKQEVEDVQASDLVDLNSGEVLLDIPMFDLIEEVRRTREFDRIEFDSDDEE